MNIRSCDKPLVGRFNPFSTCREGLSVVARSECSANIDFAVSKPVHPGLSSTSNSEKRTLNYSLTPYNIYRLILSLKVLQRGSKLKNHFRTVSRVSTFTTNNHRVCNVYLYTNAGVECKLCYMNLKKYISLRKYNIA